MTNTPKRIVTIDGPAGVGKSTLSKALAKQLNLTYIDTGAMFRAIALYTKNKGLAWSQEQEIKQLLKDITIEFRKVGEERHIFLQGVDVEKEIRQNEISLGASKVSAFASVRSQLLAWQREMGNHGNVLLEGRDTGSVVFPNADVKFYLTASAMVRAKRRFLQLPQENRPSIEDLQKEIEARDKADSEREIAPLICPEGAVVIDTSDLTEKEVLARMLSHFEME